MSTPIQSAHFRALMRHVPASVSIIATGSPGRRNGLTATSVCCVSDAPPKLIACVNHRASAHDAILDNGVFSINVLSAGDEHLAKMFSANSGASGEARFRADGWDVGVTGAPVLKHALCHLECRLSDTAHSSTHTVFFGEVVSGSARTGTSPLLYLSGAYHTLPVLLPAAEHSA